MRRNGRDAPFSAIRRALADGVKSTLCGHSHRISVVRPRQKFSFFNCSDPPEIGLTHKSRIFETVAGTDFNALADNVSRGAHAPHLGVEWLVTALPHGTIGRVR